MSTIKQAVRIGSTPECLTIEWADGAVRFALRDGDLVLFDNQRILHGRSGFSSATHARHLRGCYLTRDSVYSETGLLRRRMAIEEPS